MQPVFDAIVQTAVRLLGCETAFTLRCNGVSFLERSKVQAGRLDAVKRATLRADEVILQICPCRPCEGAGYAFPTHSLRPALRARTYRKLNGETPSSGDGRFHCTNSPRTGLRAMAEAHPGRVGRRLAAIVAADVAGYSRLMGLDEVGTASILREHRAVTDALVAKHGGRIVKTTGDGVLLEFPSVVDAVECAVAVQAVMAERNQGVPEERRMLFRIGVNLGDILVDGDDILGDGVNVAARLEGIAEPGGICIASSAYDQVCGKVAVEFTDLGEQALKNIACARLRSKTTGTSWDSCADRVTPAP